MAVVVVLFVAAGGWAATRSSGGSAGDIGGGEQRVVVPLVRLGRGELPGGVTWSLEARRDVCTSLQTSPGPTLRERCEPVRAGRAINNTSTRVVRGPSSPTYVTLAQVFERVEQVRVSSDGSEPREIATLGGDAGLGVRFFVTHTTENVDETYTALAADGSVLGRFDRPKMPN